MDTQKDWVCLNINERYNNNARYNDVKIELEEIFGNTLIDLLFVGEFLEEKVFDNVLDNYVFVKCHDIYSCRQKLIRSRLVKGILNSFEEIQFISDNEIEMLKNDWERKKESKADKIFFGDIVKVRTGLFANLTGIVTNKKKKNFVVIFKLCSNYKQASLCQTNLERIGNLFDYVKNPVTV